MSLAKFKEAYPNEPPVEYRKCASYDVVPSIAFIHNTPVYSLTASWGMRNVFTGGEDGFVRKFDFHSSLNGGQLLTASQRHMMPDSITKCGVLNAYWENEQPLPRDEYKVENDGKYIPVLSPVYSLAAQAEALWIASGLQSGGISLQSATYGEMGQCLAYFDTHTKPVSDLKLSSDETILASGSWDRSVATWDLNSGKLRGKYADLSGQVSCVDWQPLGGVQVAPPAKQDSNDDDDDKSMESLFGSDEEGEPQQKEEEPQQGGGGGEEEEEEEEEEKEEEEKANNHEKHNRNRTGNVILSATYNGSIDIWDIRQSQRASWLAGSQAPPWCTSACFSYDGNRIYAGRRNASVEEYDLRNCNTPSRILKFPAISGAVSCVTAMPNNRSLLCASFDNIRIYDLEATRKTPFFIIPGHHGAIVSRIIVDNSGKYMISACGGRGWVDTQFDVTLGYEIAPE